MVANAAQIHSVPTNIVTGFLGVGKTTTILHLLKSKPSDQRWAVLVNEFGEIGVDGGLLQGQHPEEQGVFVREVPGGCMCCAAGLPMQVALNQLLHSARPDRLLIEPTGLGHPKEVLQVLSGGAFRQTLSIQQIVTLVNARHLADPRYTGNETFNQQIEVADIVVGNKVDLYQSQDKAALESYVQARCASAVQVVFTARGALDYSVLSGLSRNVEHVGSDTSHGHSHAHDAESDDLPVCGYIKKLNSGDGYHSIGWRFREEMIFNSRQLFSFFSGIDAERIKAVVNTEKGVLGYNLSDGSLTEIALFGGGQSCIEIIGLSIDGLWETQLLQCRINPDIGAPDS